MSVFPFITPVVQEKADNLPLFKEFAFDFFHNSLKLMNGKTYLVEGNEALKIWIYKALMTVRHRHLAYTSSYGSEVDTLIGSALNRDVLQSELRRFIIESLMVNPYIIELSNFIFDRKSDGIQVEFNCKTVYGDAIIPISFKGVIW